MSRFKELYTIRFIIILCATSALLLALLSANLEKKQQKAAEFNRMRELLIAAKLLSTDGKNFIVTTPSSFLPAIYDPVSEKLLPVEKEEPTSEALILAFVAKRVIPLLVDEKGRSYTFEKAHINYQLYLKDHAKRGYAHLPFKLVYKILSNDLSAAMSYVFPINGFGLWDAIYGYLAIAPDGNRVIGTTWYEQKETPGLGAEIGSPAWQSQFFGKEIFPMREGRIDLDRSPIGIIVVKGKVKELLGEGVDSRNAVDGLSGATETGKGVSRAYSNSLTPYKPFLIALYTKEVNR